MKYICISDDRLTYKQYDRLCDIYEYLQAPVEILEWRGVKREMKGLTVKQWKMKIMTALYTFYRDLHMDDDSFNRECVVDFFDDEYITNLTSFKNRIKHMLCCN
jgi:hypothetical protein